MLLKKSALSAIGYCVILAAMLAASRWLQTYRPEDTPVFKLTTPMPRFPALEIDLLFSEHESLKRDAAKDLASRLARHFNREPERGGREIPDPPAIKFSPSAGEKEWVAFPAAVSENESILCLLSPQDSQYTLFFAQPFRKLRQLDKAELTPGEDLLWITESVGGASRKSLWRWDRERGFIQIYPPA
jgi:hypothetical protein